MRTHLGKWTSLRGRGGEFTAEQFEVAVVAGPRQETKNSKQKESKHRKQMIEQPRDRKASWMSARRS